MAAIANFTVWQLGAFLNLFGGWLDSVGARLCVITYGTAWVILAVAIVYSVVRRFVLARRQWDFYGPVCAGLALMIMYWQIEVTAR